MPNQQAQDEQDLYKFIQEQEDMKKLQEMQVGQQAFGQGSAPSMQGDMMSGDPQPSQPQQPSPEQQPQDPTSAQQTVVLHLYALIGHLTDRVDLNVEVQANSIASLATAIKTLAEANQTQESDMHIKEAEFQLKAQQTQAELQMKQQAHEQTLQQQQEQHQSKLAMEQENHQLQAQTTIDNHQQQSQLTQDKHDWTKRVDTAKLKIAQEQANKAPAKTT